MTEPSREPTIPEAGLSVEEVLQRIDDKAQHDIDPVPGLAAGSPFATGIDSLEEVAQSAYLRYWDANAMYRRYFPSIEEMERDLIAFGGSLLNAPDSSGGIVTSGGSESILLSVKAARDAARHEGDARDERIVLSQTAHPAFWKAAEYLSLKVTEVPITASLDVDLDAYGKALRGGPLLAVASAPCFTLGKLDPMTEIDALCRHHDVPLHVDGCVGGYALPWLEDIGVPLPSFDFRLPSVVSMSADLHKYGYAPRGISTMLARTEAWAAHAMFRYGRPPRPEGWYVTATVAGSRPAGAVAAAWAVTQHLGRDGYRRLAAATEEARVKVVHALTNADIEVLSNPVWSLMVYSIGDSTPRLAAGLAQRGWLVHQDVFPKPLIRLMMAPAQYPYLDAYLSDVREVAGMVRDGATFGGESDAAYT